MKFLEIMIVTGILSQMIAGEEHNLKLKRQIIPYHHNEDVTDYNSLQRHNENQIFQERYPYHDEETVGIFPIGLMRGAAKQFTRRVKTQARLHHPHHHPHHPFRLLEPTPNHLLQGDEKIEEKEADRHEANEFNPMLQSPQLYHEVHQEPSPNVLQPPTPQIVVVNKMNEHYELQTTRNKQLHHEVSKEKSPNVFQPPIAQTVVVNRMNDHYEPQTTGKVICNIYDPEEVKYESPHGKSRHSSEKEDAERVGNPFQARHFYQKGYLYGLISKHLQKHTSSKPVDSHNEINKVHTTPYSGNSEYNHHLTLNNDGSQVYGQNGQSSTTQPISSINGEKITINQNFQISQIAGNNNGVSQTQQSNQHNSNIIQNGLSSHEHENQNFQGSQIHGTYNAVSQSQASHKNNLNSMQDDFNNFFNNQNDQMSQIYGSNNAVTQSQESNHHQASVQPNKDFYPTEDQYSNTPDDNFLQIHDNENFQGSNIYGSNNAVTQQQSSNHHNIVGAPYVVHFDQVRPHYPPKRSNEQFIHSMKRRKRQLKIWNLITDPNSHLDVSQTIENVGHAARSAMEDEKHPNFHIKNAVGSAKNAIMSTMKMIPQDFIIPSDYKLIRKSEEQNSYIENAQQQSNKKESRNGLRAINPNLFEKDSRTRAGPKFQHSKFDDVPNEDQFVQTYAKVGSMVRDSVRSSKETLNHLGNVYSNARKAVAAARHSVPKMLTRSMRIPEVRRNFQRKPLEKVGSRIDFQNGFVGASEMMNSFGLLTPRPQRVNSKRNAITQNPSNHPTPDKYVVETMQVLNDAKNVVGVNSLNEFLEEMKKKYNSVYEDKIKERHSNHQLSAEARQQSLDTRNTFDALKSLTIDDVLGLSLQENSFRTFDAKNGTVNYGNNCGNCNHDNKTESGLETHDQDKHKCPCPINSGKLENFEDETEHNEKSRISMEIGEKLVTPYMGKLKHIKTEPYYDNYEDDIEFYK